MIKNDTLISCIEDLRLKKKLTLTEFTEGIVSERTYRRYINDSEAFSFEVLVSLVKRLDMRMRDLLVLAFNQMNLANQEEIYFAHYMTLRQLDHAKPYYEKLIDKELKSHLGSIYVPILMQYYQYPKDYLKFAKTRIGFNALKTTSILNRQSLDALLFMLPDLNETDTIEVITFLLRVIHKEVKLLSMSHVLDISKAIHMAFNTITKTKERILLFSEELSFLYKKALDDIISTHLVTNYPAFFEAVISYANATSDLEKRSRFIYYDVCFQMTLETPMKRTHIYSKESGLDAYKKHIMLMPLLSNEVIS
jgi:hypothetical protein